MLVTESFASLQFSTSTVVLPVCSRASFTVPTWRLLTYRLKVVHKAGKRLPYLPFVFMDGTLRVTRIHQVYDQCVLLRYSPFLTFILGVTNHRRHPPPKTKWPARAIKNKEKRRASFTPYDNSDSSNPTCPTPTLNRPLW